ncbi:glycosyltransferase family 9 protein [Aeromonas sobria]|uniref:glycosyltransferase family 9 protein n=1 Tax=Aeromonas sobria TaxID=646 RepID=UPI00111A1155|nr:glycosyltransferase family 9 protein [Aeromonas sobria]
MKIKSRLFKAIKDQLFLGRDLFRRRLARMLFDKKSNFTKQDCSISRCNGKRFLVIRWDAKLGDSIVCSWLYREIKKENENNQLVVVCNSNTQKLYEDIWGGDVFVVKKRPSYRELRLLAEKIGLVDYTIHFGEQLKMRDIYFLSKLSTSFIAGMDDDLDLINIKLGQVTSEKHFSEKFVCFFNRIGYLNIDTKYIIPAFPLVEDKISSYRWPQKSNTICFNPYGSGSSRRMDSGMIISLCDMMLRETCFSILLLGMRDQVNEIEDLVARTIEPERIFCLPPEDISIESLFSQLRMSVGLVSVDTATIHIASGLNLPTLAIYNSKSGEADQNFLNWHPNNERADVFFTKDFDGRGVNSLSVDDFESRFKQWVTQFLS